ncbi:MAG: hypothetical protein EOM37_00490 [Proteobacteria bacterium]|nr:hypothetical protein [Pseudomonadota bacterium]
MSALPKERIVASPLAKRIASQKGVDLKLIKGSGPNGRIVRADVEGFKGSATRHTARAAIPADTSAYIAIPNSTMRKVIAKRLSESKQTVPHFYLTVDCEIDELVKMRKQMNEILDVRVSVNDFIIRAIALALQKVPAANASWTDGAILQYKHANISVAVATPTGLITPIVQAAELKSVQVISAEMKDLVARAREGKLKPHEFQGGGFSLSNLGMFGVKDFAPIINPPQACILAVGAGEQRAVVKHGQLAIATMMSCTLSVDHRAVDGAVGAQFLSAFKDIIQKPLSMVL